MSFNFHFRSLEDRKELSDLINFLNKQNLGYPEYDSWVQRTENELDTGYKKAILAFSEKNLVGNLVYQTHKGDSSFLELKNLRVLKNFRLRDFARFMLKQAEVENLNYKAIICDIPFNQPEIIKFMESQGYNLFLKIPLYEKDTPDVVMIKYLEKRELIIPAANKIIYDKAV